MKNAVLVLLVFAAGCAKQPEPVAAPAPSPVVLYFDKLIRGKEPYRLAGVSGFEVRAYELVNSAPDFATVRITYASGAGTDLVKTKRFTVDQSGRLQAVEIADIHGAIRENLALVAMAAKLTTRFNGKPITWATMVEQGKVTTRMFPQFAGEDYSTVSIEPDGRQGYIVRLELTSGVVLEASAN